MVFMPRLSRVGLKTIARAHLRHNPARDDDENPRRSHLTQVMLTASRVVVFQPTAMSTGLRDGNSGPD
jgi:hypothetical protein